MVVIKKGLSDRSASSSAAAAPLAVPLLLLLLLLLLSSTVDAAAAAICFNGSASCSWYGTPADIRNDGSSPEYSGSTRSLDLGLTFGSTKQSAKGKQQQQQQQQQTCIVGHMMEHWYSSICSSEHWLDFWVTQTVCIGHATAAADVHCGSHEVDREVF
jgi:hypothetical protein